MTDTQKAMPHQQCHYPMCAALLTREEVVAHLMAAHPLSPLCDECGKRYIAIAIDLGDFVVGRTSTQVAACIPCAKWLLEHSVNGFVMTVSSRAESYMKITSPPKGKGGVAIWTVEDPDGNVVHVQPFHRENRHRPVFLLAQEAR